jgi:Domain of unknown function (DUF6983)
VSGSITTAYEVPLTPASPTTFTIPLAGVTYTLTVKWNPVNAYWVLDVADSSGTVPIVGGIPLVTGADLLEQYGYLSFGGQLICQTDFDVTAPPTWSNLGTTGHLFFLVTS